MDERTFATRQCQRETDVIEFYDQYSSQWDERFGRSISADHFHASRWASLREALAHDCGPGRTAVELGVGTGPYIEKASRLFDSIVAVDGSAGMLKILNSKVKRDGIKNVSTVQSSVLHMPFLADGSIDVAYFFGLFEHVVDTSAFAKELGRILKSGGVVIGVTPNARSPWYHMRRFVRGTGKHCSTDRYCTYPEVKGLFQGHGFTFEHVHYWGTVPADLQSRFLFGVLRLAEAVVAMTPLDVWLGGLTFKCRRR